MLWTHTIQRFITLYFPNKLYKQNQNVSQGFHNLAFCFNYLFNKHHWFLFLSLPYSEIELEKNPINYLNQYTIHWCGCMYVYTFTLLLILNYSRLCTIYTYQNSSISLPLVHGIWPVLFAYLFTMYIFILAQYTLHFLQFKRLFIIQYLCVK